MSSRGRSERSVAAVTKRNHTLRLFNIVPELSGSYKCKVSSLIDEDFKQMDMLVYCEYDTKAKKGSFVVDGQLMYHCID